MTPPRTDAQCSAPERTAFPFDRRFPFDLPDEYTALRSRSAPARVPLRTGGGTVLLTRYADVAEALVHPALSNDRGAPQYPSPIAIPPELRTGGSLLSMDPPQHTRARRMVAAEFTHRRAQEMRPRVQSIVDEAVDDLLAAGPPADLHRGLGVRVTLAVITELLGITLDDQRFLLERTRAMFGGEFSAEQRRAALAELDEYVIDIVRRKRDDPQDDLISRLVVHEGERVSLSDLADLTRLLLNGGYDSTSSMISLGVLTLLCHPEQWAALVRDPDLAPLAVEELLRYLSVADLTAPRVATRDVVLGGCPIAHGAGVTPSLGAANRDPEVFDRPEELDISRGSRRHLSFGHGRHLCLGAELARVELEVAYRTVARRLPALRLAVPEDQIRFRGHGLVFGLEDLPVTWDAPDLDATTGQGRA